MSTRGGGWGSEKMCKGVKRHKHRVSVTNKSHGCNVQHRDYNKKSCIAYLTVAMTADLKSTHHKKNVFLVAMCTNGR